MTFSFLLSQPIAKYLCHTIEQKFLLVSYYLNGSNFSLFEPNVESNIIYRQAIQISGMRVCGQDSGTTNFGLNGPFICVCSIDVHGLKEQNRTTRIFWCKIKTLTVVDQGLNLESEQCLIKVSQIEFL